MLERRNRGVSPFTARRVVIGALGVWWCGYSKPAMILMVRDRTTTLKRKAAAVGEGDATQAVVLDLHVRDLECHADNEGEVEEVPVVGPRTPGKSRPRASAAAEASKSP